MPYYVASIGGILDRLDVPLIEVADRRNKQMVGYLQERFDISRMTARATVAAASDLVDEFSKDMAAVGFPVGQ